MTVRRKRCLWIAGGLVSILLLSSCSPRDAKLREQIIGTWIRGDRFEITLATDGSFVSQWTQPTKSLTYQGSWMVRDGDVVSTCIWFR